MDERTADLFALRSLAETYAIGCDDRDADLLASIFTEGSTITVHWLDRDPTTLNMPGDAPKIPKGLSRYDRTMHFVGNHRAKVDGDEAAGETYCFAHHITGTNDYIMAIRYQDTYRREAGTWKITSRTLRLQWTQDVEVDARPARPA